MTEQGDRIEGILYKMIPCPEKSDGRICQSCLRLAKEAKKELYEAVMEGMPKEKTEEDFLDIFNPERDAAIGEFTYAKNGANYTKANFEGYNQALSEWQANIAKMFGDGK